MIKYNKTIIALLIGAMSVVGAASLAAAAPAGGMGRGGPAYRSGITPDMREMMEKAYNEIAPLQMELRAKQDELTAKIYGGADEKTVQDVSKQVIALQTRLTEARVKMQQQFAKAGLPLRQSGCPMMGGMGMMGGMPHHPMHGQMMMDAAPDADKAE